MSLNLNLRGILGSLLRVGIGGPQLKNNSGALESRNPTDAGYAIFRAGTTAPANSNNDVVDLGYARPAFQFNVVQYGAVGDGVTDNTAAWASAIAACKLAGGGTIVVPEPLVSYLFTGGGPGTFVFTIDFPNVRIQGCGGVDSADYPELTLGTYGGCIFNVTTDHVTIANLGAQYGPTTTVTGTVASGATSFVPASTAGIVANDWLVLDQYPNLEQVQVLSVVAGTVNLKTATTITHTGTWWVRDQATVSGTVYGTPARDVAGMVNFVTGNGCAVLDCGVQAMVTGVKFRGIPSSNSQNNANNRVSGLRTNFVQFGTLAQQQDGFTCSQHTYENATGGQATAPGHGLYMTGLTGFASAWNGGTTYEQYHQVSFGGVQYISRINGNVGNQPDISPADWSAQTFPTSATGWRSRSTNLKVTDITGVPGLNFKDWSAVKVKFTLGGSVKGIIVSSAVRGFDYQEFHEAVTTGASMRDFIPPASLDSSAATADILNCNSHVFAGFSVSLTQAPVVGSIGGPIDMPVVLERVDGTVDPYTGIALGHDNAFVGFLASTNYDNLFTSAAYRAQGIRTRFLACQLIEQGGQNPYAFYFSQNSTAGTFANAGVLQRPVVVGTTSIAQVSTGTTSSYWDIDNNLVPAGANYNDVNGVVTTNSFVTNVAGTSDYSPQATGTDVITGKSPIGFVAKWVNLTDSNGNTVFSVNVASGTKGVFASSDATQGGYVGVGLNATAGYPGVGTIGGIAAVVNGGNPSNGGAGVFFLSEEAQNVAALGTSISLRVITPATTTQYKAIRIWGSGDVVQNDTGAALATAATAGFFFLASMAGQPTGSVTGHTGTAAVVWDSTDQTLWVNTGAATWVQSSAPLVAGSGPANGTTFTPGSYQRVGSGQSGFGYVLADPTKCKGSRITVQCTNSGAVYQYSFTSAGSGPPTINGSASYEFVSQFSLASVTFISDGANWRTEEPTPPANVYTEDYPAFHGFVEWNGQPAFTSANTAPVTQSVHLMRYLAQAGGLISNVVFQVTTLGSGLAAPTTAAITNVVNNGSGFCRVSAAGHTYSTNDVITQAGIVGATEANTADVITVIDANTYDLNTTPFTSAYVSGGTATRSACVVAVYDSAGAFVTATGDLSTTLTSTGVKTVAFARTFTATKGSAYYVAFLYGGSALVVRCFGQASSSNMGLGATTIRWSINGTGATKLASSITVGSNTGTNAISMWSALS